MVEREERGVRGGDVPALVEGEDGDALLCKLVEDVVVAYDMLNEARGDEPRVVSGRVREGVRR